MKDKIDDQIKAAFMLGMSIGMELMCGEMSDDDKHKLFDLITLHKHTARHVAFEGGGFNLLAVNFMLETFDKIMSRWTPEINN